MRICDLFLAALLLPLTSHAATDPFTGKWKGNPVASTLNDEMKLELVSPNRYAITFAPGATDTITADGTDQPALRGTTFSIAILGPNAWKAMRKNDGKTLVSAIWTLSSDGKTLTDDYTAFPPDGPPIKLNYIYNRTAGVSGLAGTWDSASGKMTTVIDLDIQPYQAEGTGVHGLAFKSSAAEMTRNVTPDSRDYPGPDLNATPGATSAARRTGGRTLEITDKTQGKVTKVQQFELSADLKTLTITTRLTGENRPKSILVFDRQ